MTVVGLDVAAYKQTYKAQISRRHPHAHHFYHMQWTADGSVFGTSSLRFFVLWPPPYVIGQAIYIFILSLVLLFFFPRLISAVADWTSTILPHMVWP